jgi:hypothetical protein
MSSLCAEPPHDHKGHSEEKCLRCGWVMGRRPLNCINNDTPHVFPSQQAEIERLRALVDDYENSISWETTCTNCAKLLDDNYDQYCEIEGLRGIQRAVVALARTVLGKSEHPVERSPWIDVIHMMDEDARTNGSASATDVGGPS